MVMVRATAVHCATMLHPPPAPLAEWKWKDETFADFLSNVKVEYEYERSRRVIVHNNPNFRSFIHATRVREVRRHTPAILMTETVWKGFRSERPDDNCVKKKLIYRVDVKTPGYNGAVFGSSVIFTDLKE